jgi:hypothetical protein
LGICADRALGMGMSGALCLYECGDGVLREESLVWMGESGLREQRLR